MMTGTRSIASRTRRTLRRALLGLVLASAATACAPKVTAPPVVTAPRFPDYVFPASPAGLGTPATIERQKAGWQWLQAGDFRAADRNFNAALKLTPAFYPAEAGLGYSALARKDPKAALQHFDRAVAADPGYAPALAGRGDALLALGQREPALQSFESAVAADPTLASLKSSIGVLRLRGLQDDVAGARAAAEAGRFSEARQAYQRAIAASPESPFLYRELAAVERRDNDPAAALAHARKAADLDPNDPRALAMAGEILEAQGADKEALQAFSAALALEPDPALSAKVEALEEKLALAALPDEYRAIESSPSLTRAQLAAVLGVRLDALLKRSARQTAVVMTDTRNSWAAPWILLVARAGLMEVYPNHTFQPSALVRRADLAQVASRALNLVAAEHPALAARLRRAPRRRFPDVSQANLSYSAVSLVVDAGVMSTESDGSFQPTRPATGAEAVAAVKKLEELASSTR
jgi:tetratricopeptide (TPR) repeat protein